MSKRKKTIIGATAAVAVLAIAGVAYAMWSAGGSGVGRAQASESVVAVVNSADGTPDLYPGFTGGDVSFTITNDNPYPIQFTTMTPGLVSTSDPDCDPSQITVEGAEGLNLIAPPGESTTLTIPDVVSMSPTAPDTCQGTVFELDVDLTGVQTTT